MRVPRTDREVLRMDPDVALDRAVDPHMRAGRLQVTLRAALELDATARSAQRCRRSRSPGRR